MLVSSGFGMNGWMFSTVRLLVVPLSATLFSLSNVSSLIHVSKLNHSKAIDLSKDNKERKKERKKEREKEERKKERKRERRLKMGHLAWLSAKISFSCV